MDLANNIEVPFDSEEEKEENKIILGLRILVERAIGGIKRFNVLKFP